MYIVLEGIVGSGKTTQVQKLVEYFRRTPFVKGDKGDFVSGKNPQSLRDSSFAKELREVIHVREPGSTPIAEDIRHLAQGKEWEKESMHPLTNAYLYTAARSQTLHTIVKPTLDAGQIVISDRCFLSSCAYQGEAQ
jgi:dTMP kinase